jgi:hypothetical protein
MMLAENRYPLFGIMLQRGTLATPLPANPKSVLGVGGG